MAASVAVGNRTERLIPIAADAGLVELLSERLLSGACAR
jgi:hypothetical protein